MRLAAAVSVLALLTAAPALAQSPDRQAINGIIDQGLNHSEVMQTAGYLTDRIGGRMTNSPQMRQAEAWTQQRFTTGACPTFAPIRSISVEAGRPSAPAPG